MQDRPDPRRFDHFPLLLLVILLTTAIPLLVLAAEAPARDGGPYSAMPVMETVRGVSIEDRQTLIGKAARNLSDTYLYAGLAPKAVRGRAVRGAT